MARTYVRYCRRGIAVAAARLNWQAPPLLTTGLVTSEQVYLGLIGLQVLLAVLLWSHGTLDVPVALCQAATLLAISHLHARDRVEAEGLAPCRPVLAIAAETVAAPVADAPVPSLAAAALADPAPTQRSPGPQPDGKRVPPSPSEPPARCALDADGQTWGDLMARISHEIRTPLNAVIGFTELMNREVYGPLGHERYRDYLAHIRESGEALLRSAEDTLALSAMLAKSAPDQRAQSTALTQLVADAAQYATPAAERRDVDLQTSLPEALDIAGDRRALRQAITNLLVEAATRTAPGGTVSISAIACADRAKLTITALECEARNMPPRPSLPLCVARALLELEGVPLTIEGNKASKSWRATLSFDLTLQPDFFGGPGRA